MTFPIPVSQRACCAIRLLSFDWTNPGCLLASLASYYGKKYCAHIFPWQNELLTFWGLLRTKGDTCSDKTVDPADWVTLCVCVLEEIRGRQKAALPVRPVSNIQTKHRRHCVNAAIPVCMQSPELCDCVPSSHYLFIWSFVHCFCLSKIFLYIFSGLLSLYHVIKSPKVYAS